MSYEQKPGQGSLFKNKHKETNPKAPDYQGSANINGVTYQLAAWIKRPEGKQPFMSLAIKVEEKKGITKKDVEEVFNDGAPF